MAVFSDRPASLWFLGTMILVCITLAAGCDNPSNTTANAPAAPSAPTESEARTALVDVIKSSFGGTIELTSLQKTDGQSRLDNGVSIYRLFYDGQVTVRVYCRLGQSSDRSLVVSANPMNVHVDVNPKTPPETRRQMEDAVVRQLDPNVRVTGDTAPIHGEVVFEKTERGWRYRSCTVLPNKTP